MLLTPEFFKITFEWTCIGLFLICLVHSLHTYGKHRTFREFLCGFILSAGCENIGVLSGAYVYPGFGFYFFDIPLVNPLSWVALVYLIMHITNSIFPKVQTSGSVFLFFLIAIIDSSMALAVDLMMDPLATIYNWWIWVDPSEIKVVKGTVDPYNFNNMTHMVTPDQPIHDFFAGFFTNGTRYPTRPFGIPLINFLSWFVFVLVFSFLFRLIESRSTYSDSKKTLILLSIMILVTPFLCFLLITPNL